MPRLPDLTTALKHSERCLANIARNNGKFNIFVSQRDTENVLSDTRKSVELNKGMICGHNVRSTFANKWTELSGQVFALKDNYCEPQLPTTCGSKALEGMARINPTLTTEKF